MPRTLTSTSTSTKGLHVLHVHNIIIAAESPSTWPSVRHLRLSQVSVPLHFVHTFPAISELCLDHCQFQAPSNQQTNSRLCWDLNSLDYHQTTFADLVNCSVCCPVHWLDVKFSLMPDPWPGTQWKEMMPGPWLDTVQWEAMMPAVVSLHTQYYQFTTSLKSLAETLTNSAWKPRCIELECDETSGQTHLRLVRYMNIAAEILTQLPFICLEICVQTQHCELAIAGGMASFELPELLPQSLRYVSLSVQFPKYRYTCYWYKVMATGGSGKRVLVQMETRMGESLREQMRTPGCDFDALMA
ncbi:hypothetical protein SCP_1600350 [Sparassis crispa]|uniref:Uncharacterized protein n=1 Tax=Sparassis crispa TaxID=139825 RepID=A0A401H4M8_9APHY|nr:hypothetical protein SCP_1600350 [Sparassis crispa]GBE89374.1 hypothetical protein SCP_1600350 [Sparassis crispa]